MKAQFEVEDPEMVKFTATMTMTLSEWRRVSTGLRKANGEQLCYTRQEFIKAIEEMTSLAAKHFIPSNHSYEAE